MTTFGSLTLDSKTCILTYDGTRDLATTGVKPIAIMIEGRVRKNGVSRSGIPG